MEQWLGNGMHDEHHDGNDLRMIPRWETQKFGFGASSDTLNRRLCGSLSKTSSLKLHSYKRM